MSDYHKFKFSFPRTIWAIGIASLLMNLATAVVFAQSALYLKIVIGASVATIGYIDAFVEFLAYFLRIFSGALSDYLKKRKMMMVFGFVLLTISKPILAFSKTALHVFISRTIDRLGNGIQASPRDALVSDSAPTGEKGASHGFRQSLSVIGSTLGAVFGLIVMKATGNDFNLLFLLISIPAFIALLILIIFVKDKVHEKKKSVPMQWKDAKRLGKRFWILMVVTFIVTLGRFSEMFISLHAVDTFKLDVGYSNIILLIYNIMSAIVSYPTGHISDKMKRTNLLVLGFVMLLLAHMFIGFSGNLTGLIVGTFLWGIQFGVTQNISVTLVSDYVPKELRGTGFGMYYFVVAISTAIASSLAGNLAASHTMATPFMMGSVFTFIALISLLMVKRFLDRQPEYQE